MQQHCCVFGSFKCLVGISAFTQYWQALIQTDLVSFNSDKVRANWFKLIFVVFAWRYGHHRPHLVFCLFSEQSKYCHYSYQPRCQNKKFQTYHINICRKHESDYIYCIWTEFLIRRGVVLAWNLGEMAAKPETTVWVYFKEHFVLTKLRYFQWDMGTFSICVCDNKTCHFKAKHDLNLSKWVLCLNLTRP